MKLNISLLVLLASISFLCSCFDNNQSANNSKEPLTDLKFNKKFINFGTITQDTLLRAEYILYNTGQNPLKIKYVDPDCQCTSYNLSKNNILPNDSALITLNIDTHDKYGEIKLYTIVCANTKAKFYKLTMKLNIE